MDNNVKEFKQKVKNRQFAIDHSWQGGIPSQGADAPADSQIPMSQDQHIWSSLEDNLYAADMNKWNTGHYPITSSVRYAGRLIVFLKKAFRKLIETFLGWYLSPIFNHQNTFNGKLLNAVSLERELIVRLENRIVELDNSNKQLKAELDSARRKMETQAERLEAETRCRETAMDAVAVSIKSLDEKLLQESETRNAKEEILNEKLGELDIKLFKIENLPTTDDDFYHDFEEKFRGSREDIRNRLQTYVPLIKAHLEDWSKARFIDVGSGRGEWLDILRYYGATDYVGVDLNKRQNAICEENGHKTVCVDCIEYLKEQEDESVDLISGFQIIEHLCMSDLLELLKQSHRVLKKGGMILFETPNPRTIIVGANTFYTDPSHKRPLEPQVVAFFAEWTGFAKVTCIDANSSEASAGMPLPDENHAHYQIIKELNDIKWVLFGPMDYALFAVKE